MAENVDGGGLRRKKRRIGQKDHGKEDQEAQEAPQNLPSSAAPAYDFLHLASFILEWDIPILFPGSARPRNSYAMIGSGGSFLVFNEVRTMDDVIIRPEEVRSLADKMVLKRTRAHQLHPEAGASNDSIRYSSIMAELQVLTNRSIAEHENFIDLLGLTWDFEPDSDGINSVWPVLALEAAECSMEMHMYDLGDAPLSQKIKYCRDVATALEFLHERGVVHCDVKLENVLICVTSLSGSVAKLSDFGSALLDITPDTKLPYGVVGTRPWNAPEYAECLQGLDIFKLDVFSYGMLLWRSISHSGILEELSRSQGAERESILNSLEEKKKSDQLVQVAIQDLKQTCGESPELSAVIGLLESTFSSHPKKRLTMAEVKTSLDGMAVQLSDDSDEVESEAGSPHEEMDDPVESPGISEYTNESPLEELQADDARILPAPIVPLYNDFEMFYERFEDETLALNQQLIRVLKLWASRREQSESVAAEAAYQLSVCYVNGFGVEPNMSEGAKWTLEAARLGSHKARANVYRMSEVVSHLGAGRPSHFQQIISWLKEAAELGSQQALNDLRVLDLKSYTCAWTKWRHRFCEINDTNGNAILSESELLIRCQGLNADSLDHLVLNARGHRPIHLAASLGYTKALQDLIRTGVDIDMRNNRGETALLCACRAGHACLARNLLRLGAKVRRAKSGETPLHWLIAFDEEKVEEVAKELIARGAELEQQHVVTESNDYTFDVYPHGTPLDWAVTRRKMAAIKVLIELGADPFNECSEHSPFVRAVSLHDTEVVKVLVRSAHATPERLKMLDSTGQSLLFHAIYCNEPYQRILQHGAEAMNAARDTIKILLDGGCDPSCVDKDGNSIMHLAAGFCDADFIKMLLTIFDCVKYINTPCGERARTPIHHAIASGKLEVVKLLLFHGADTSCISEGRTLLHLSVAGDETYSIQWLKLLDLPNRKDLDALAIQSDAQQGLTAFEMAVLRCKLELADFLLTSGADSRGPKGREPHFVSLLIGDPSWDSPSALQYYLLKAAPPFITRASSQLSALHVSASMLTYLADSVTGELKLDLLLKVFSKPSQINARTRRSEGSDALGGQTPLHYAAKFGVYFAARRLIEVGADVAAKDEKENSPLDLAKMQLEIVRERVMRHEMPRVISDLEDTVKLLEGAVEGRSLPGPRRRPSIGEYTRARFSRLGFQTGSL